MGGIAEKLDGQFCCDFSKRYYLLCMCFIQTLSMPDGHANPIRPEYGVSRINRSTHCFGYFWGILLYFKIRADRHIGSNLEISR